MEKEEIIKKMRELREKRDIEILESQMEKINLNSDYQEDLKDNKVLNVKYLGTIDINGEDKGIYLIIEQQKDKEGNLVEIEKYYTEDFEFLGGNNRGDGYDFIMLSMEYADNEDLLEELNGLDKEGELDLAKLEKEELIEIARALGIKEEDIEKMSEIDLVEEIEEEKEQDNEPDKSEEELDKEETSKLIEGKQEIKLSTKVDEKSTLGNKLGLDAGEYTKIAIVYSEKLNEIQGQDQPINSTRYSFVAIRSDGTAQVINDKLQLDAASGRDANNDAIKIDADKTARKDDKTVSRYKIAGKEEYLSVEPGQYGEVKAYYGKGKTREDNMNVETQLETSNVRPTDIEIRRLQSDRKGQYNTDEIAKEAKEHFDGAKEERISLESADGDKNTVDHVHYEFVEQNIDQWAELMMENDDIEKMFTTNEVKEMIQHYLEENVDQNKEYTVEEMNEEIKKIEDKIEQDANNLDRARNSH